MNKKFLIIILAAIVLAAVGGLYWYLSQPAEEEADLYFSQKPLELETPDFGFYALSDLDTFDLGELDTGQPSLPDFSDFSFSQTYYDESDVDLQAPEAQVEADTSNLDIDIPSSAQQGQQQEEEQEPPAQSQVNSENCAQFSGVPDCSYVSDPQGRELCEDCKAAGY